MLCPPHKFRIPTPRPQTDPERKKPIGISAFENIYFTTVVSDNLAIFILVYIRTYDTQITMLKHKIIPSAVTAGMYRSSVVSSVTIHKVLTATSTYIQFKVWSFSNITKYIYVYIIIASQMHLYFDYGGFFVGFFFFCIFFFTVFFPLLSAMGSPPPHKQPPHVPPTAQLCPLHRSPPAFGFMASNSSKSYKSNLWALQTEPQTTLCQRTVHVPIHPNKEGRAEGCFSLSEQTVLPSCTTYLLIQQEPSAVSSISHRSHLVFPAAERRKHSSGHTKPVCLWEGLGAKLCVLPSQKNSSKDWVHTCCINMYICAYIHTYTHDAAIQNLQHRFVSWLPLCRVQHAENWHREKNPTQLPPQMNLSTTVRTPHTPAAQDKVLPVSPSGFISFPTAKSEWWSPAPVKQAGAKGCWQSSDRCHTVWKPSPYRQHGKQLLQTTRIRPHCWWWGKESREDNSTQRRMAILYKSFLYTYTYI